MLTMQEVLNKAVIHIVLQGGPSTLNGQCHLPVGFLLKLQQAHDYAHDKI